MSLHVIKWDNPGDELVWRFPDNELSTMSQLIVNESQTAILFKGGQRCDIFGAGRHSLSTQNIPILGRLLALPFSGNSPFSAEVYFVNQTIPLNLKFGTPVPLQLEDPVYQVVVPVRAFGQFGLQIEDPGVFVHKIVGANSGINQSALVEYFKGILISRLRSKIAQTIVRQKIGVLEIETMLDEISRQIEQEFAPDYAEYGLGIRAFRIMSISVPEDDPTVLELKKAKATAARRRIEGTTYAQERQFEVLETSAGNEGAGGAFASIGTGLGMGQAIALMAQQNIGVAGPAPFTPQENLGVSPPFSASFPPPVLAFFIHMNGHQMGPYSLSVLSQGVASGQFNPQSIVWRQGMNSWMPASQVPELQGMFAPPPPGTPPPNPFG
jgi:membrane protease subunit (stomatin/prohibitin family)